MLFTSLAFSIALPNEESVEDYSDKFHTMEAYCTVTEHFPLKSKKQHVFAQFKVEIKNGESGEIVLNKVVLNDLVQRNPLTVEITASDKCKVSPISGYWLSGRCADVTFRTRDKDGEVLEIKRQQATVLDGSTQRFNTFEAELPAHNEEDNVYKVICK